MNSSSPLVFSQSPRVPMRLNYTTGLNLTTNSPHLNTKCALNGNTHKSLSSIASGEHQEFEGLVRCSILCPRNIGNEYIATITITNHLRPDLLRLVTR